MPSGTAAAICKCSDKELEPLKGKLKKEGEEGKVTLADSEERCEFK